MAYPSASSLWMNDINTIIHPSGISEHDSGSISVSCPLMVPNEDTQARGNEAFRGVSFYQSYHLLNLPSPAAGWRRNGSPQTVEFGVSLPLNQQANPQTTGYCTKQLQQNLETIADACVCRELDTAEGHCRAPNQQWFFSPWGKPSILGSFLHTAKVTEARPHGAAEKHWPG